MSPAGLTVEELSERIDARDPTVWPAGNVSRQRLGWLDAPRELERRARELERWAEGIDQDTVVVLATGELSLGPAVLGSVRDAFGEPKGRRIVVCDTTDPTTIMLAPLEDAFVLVCSKAGMTPELSGLYAHARERVKDPKRFAVVTDPRSPLAAEAEERGVHRIFLERPDLEGPYSVLSLGGVVPAALAGYDIAELCGRALDLDRRDAVELGIEIGGAALEGQDKTTILTDETHRSFGLWAEQLIAGSTGKLGMGCIPVPVAAEEHGADRHLVNVRLGTAHELGAELFRFELAAAAAAHMLRVDPFAEPDAAESNERVAALLSTLPVPEIDSVDPDAVAAWLAEEVRPGDYVSIQAYLPYGSEPSLEALRKKVRDDHDGMAVTAGYGPRFLYSTGQLHKGGPSSVLAIQLVRRSPQPDVPVAGEHYDFATLIAAQSAGDYESLAARGRRVLRVVTDDPAELL